MFSKDETPRSCLSTEESHTAAVDPGIVGRRRHSLEIVLTLDAVNASASQLAVIDFNLVALHRLLHCHQGICTQQIRFDYFGIYNTLIWLVTKGCWTTQFHRLAGNSACRLNMLCIFCLWISPPFLVMRQGRWWERQWDSMNDIIRGRRKKDM